MIAYFWRYSSCSDGRDIYKNGNNSNLLLKRVEQKILTAIDDMICNYKLIIYCMLAM